MITGPNDVAVTLGTTVKPKGVYEVGYHIRTIPSFTSPQCESNVSIWFLAYRLFFGESPRMTTPPFLFDKQVTSISEFERASFG